VNLHHLVDGTFADTKLSLGLFGPELTLCVTIFLILVVRIWPRGEKANRFVFLIAIAGSALALLTPCGGQPWNMLQGAESYQRVELFTGMIVYDGLTVFIRGLLLVFAILFIVMTWLTGFANREDTTDVYTLVLGATLGMCLMASANHLLMIFLAVEMASVPSYVMAGLRRSRRKAGEAALKYSVYGAGAAGVMLYGISLVAGLANSAHLPTIAAELAAKTPAMQPSEMMVLALGGLMIMVGLAFKLSAVPFHFWCPDVFEGAGAEVSAFLSVASKAAALALLLRVAIGFGLIQPDAEWQSVAKASPSDISSPSDIASQEEITLFNVADEEGSAEAAAESSEVLVLGASALSTPGSPSVLRFISLLVAFVAIITCTFGNLAAYGQTNINRLLAYSTIAHAGYMMMAIPAVVAAISQLDAEPVLAREAARGAIAALAIYIGIYMFMNLGAFMIVAFLRNALGTENISDYAGLVRRMPGVVVCFAVILFSLVGLPPLAGFVGKFAIFAALVNSYNVSGSAFLIVLLVVGGLNTAISLFYYLRVVKVMTIDDEPEERLPSEASIVSLPGAYIACLAAMMLILFVGWNWLGVLAENAARYVIT
jgi:NADH-quinone oxidoreductase subunit N